MKRRDITLYIITCNQASYTSYSESYSDIYSDSYSDSFSGELFRPDSSEKILDRVRTFNKMLNVVVEC